MLKAEDYFNDVIKKLIFSEKIKSFNVLKKRIIGNELYFRIKIFFVNDTILGVSNYLCFNSEIEILRYSYNWFDKELIIRWDNSEHHKEIVNYPFHKHIGKDKVVSDKPRFIFEILEFIENEIEKEIENKQTTSLDRNAGLVGIFIALAITALTIVSAEIAFVSPPTPGIGGL